MQRSLSRLEITNVTDYNPSKQNFDIETDPQVLGRAGNSVGTMPTYDHKGKLIQLELYTSSKVGKIRQRINIACWRDEWKVQGIWYDSLGASIYG